MDGLLFAINGSTSMREVPLVLELLSYVTQFIWGRRGVKQIACISVHDGLADLRNEGGHGVVDYLETELHRPVSFTGG